MQMNLIEKSGKIKLFLVLLLIACFVYIQIFSSGFIGDDVDQVYNYALVDSPYSLTKVFFYHHKVLESSGSILSGYYKPLMLFYIYSIRMLFGPNPFFYHTIQIALVGINSFLVFLFFSKFFKKNISLLLAVIFLIHPINQEVAAYVSNIQEVLFFFFGLSALLLSFKKNVKLKDCAFISLLVTLSLLSKETGILFLIILVFYHFLFRKKFFRAVFLANCISLCIYIWFRFSSQNTNVFWIEPPPLAKIALFERIKHIPIIFFYYVKTFFYPNNLAFNQQWIIRSFNFQTFFLPFLFDMAFIGFFTAGAILSVKRKLFEKKLLFFFIGWFVIGVIPHLQIIPLDATVATRWFYFSCVGVLGIAGIFFEAVIKRFPRKEKVIVLGLIIVCIAFGARTMARNSQWKDAFTLYSADASSSQSPLLENNLGNEYFKVGDQTNAKIHFQKALQLSPNLWIAVNNLGILEEHNGNFEKAYYYYTKALRENDRLPMYENIARILVLSKKLKEAEQFTKDAIKKYPLSAKLWLTLSLAHYDLGEYTLALPEAIKSYELLPDPGTQNVINAINLQLKK